MVQRLMRTHKWCKYRGCNLFAKKFDSHKIVDSRECQFVHQKHDPIVVSITEGTWSHHCPNFLDLGLGHCQAEYLLKRGNDEWKICSQVQSMDKLCESWVESKMMDSLVKTWAQNKMARQLGWISLSSFVKGWE